MIKLYVGADGGRPTRSRPRAESRGGFRRVGILRICLTLVLAAALCDLQSAWAVAFHPTTFQEPDGAITLNADGKYVEPYFATKALIVAQDGGLDIRVAALAWINWALPRQRPDGLFRRFCRNNNNNDWRDCAPADADDSMLALWMQLLYRMSPPGGLPAAWQRSVVSSAKQLEKLYNQRLGVYHISRRNHVALLMDNIEVYAALQDVAREQLHLGDSDAAEKTNVRAEKLKSAIDRVFWDRRHKRFNPSMQKDHPAFYPDDVAQVYPWLANMNAPGEDAHEAWEQWKRAFGAGWIERRYDTHPWGLVALAAEKVGDSSAAACWTSHADPLRGSASWNVLEEAVWQALEARFVQQQLLDPHVCQSILTQ
jgi:hypothetical protein